MSVQIELLPPPVHKKTASSGRKRRSQDSMLSEQQQHRQQRSTFTTSSSSSSIAFRRESLKLSFNRNLSEPHAPPEVNSVEPSFLRPSKRSRVEQEQHHDHQKQQQQDQQQAAGKVVPTMAPPSCTPSPPSNCFLRPPPNGLMAPGGTVSLPTSPSSESSIFQRALLLQHTGTIGCDHLASRLEKRTKNNNNKEDLLLIDCRPFIAFNVNHIRGAINVNCCDRFNRKRLQQGKATLADLATTKEGKEQLKQRNWKEVVVYDDCSESLETLPVNHALFLVINALVEDCRKPVLLLGGLRDFHAAHQSLCADHLMRHHDSSVSPLSPLSGDCPGYLSLDGSPTGDLPSPFELCNTTKDIENFPATQVLPYLYLGNMRDAADSGVLKRLGVKYVLNVTAKPPNYQFEPGVVYKQLEAADNGVQNLRQFFEEAFAFIDLARHDRSGVLIHCHAGVSRSPTIAVAYLMKRFPMAMADAYKFVKTKRSIISPNLNFMGQLWEFEQGLQSEAKKKKTRAKATTAKKEDTEKKEEVAAGLSVEMREVRESLISTEEASTGVPPAMSSTAVTAPSPAPSPAPAPAF